MTVAGNTGVLSAPGQPSTPVFFCRACDVYRSGALPGTHAGSDYRASYTRPSLERHWRSQRDGFYRYLLRLIQESLPAGRAAPIVVDFGSCYGHFLSLAAQRGYRVVGVEINPELVSITRRMGFATVTSLGAVPPGVDVITFIDSFYYVESPEDVLRQAKAKLRDDGIVLLRVTNRNWFATLRRRLGLDDLGVLGDALISYSPGALRKLLEGAGFRVDRVIADGGAGKTLGCSKKSAYRMLQLLTALSGNRVVLTPGVILIAAPEPPRWT